MRYARADLDLKAPSDIAGISRLLGSTNCGTGAMARSGTNALVAAAVMTSRVEIVVAGAELPRIRAGPTAGQCHGN